MNRILEDDDLMTAYQYEVGKISPLFRFTNKKEFVIKRIIAIVSILAAMFAGLFFLAGIGEGFWEQHGMYGTYLLRYPKLSLIIFILLLIFDGLLWGWLKIAARLEEDAFTAASRAVFSYRRAEEKRERENRDRIVLPMVEAHKEALRRQEQEHILVDASAFFATRNDNEQKEEEDL